ncbi:hypothetical protein E2C01_047785 [Portunus trituberculatus]|uniref:Uncharacterized protein n=1 Tax=Portunus trituberculatus TaxID=210409 RepID=A0A5B7G4I0_PORTR|nr:hypothetical protein [Portunus trituberculatus]
MDYGTLWSAVDEKDGVNLYRFTNLLEAMTEVYWKKVSSPILRLPLSSYILPPMSCIVWAVNRNPLVCWSKIKFPILEAN